MASFLPRRTPADRLTFDVDAGKRCDCPDWPCTASTCAGCPACVQHGGPLISAAEERWVLTGAGLSEQEVERLRRLSVDHTPTPRAPGAKPRKRKVS